MTYRGRVQNGVVVLDSDVALRDGTEVRVEPVEETAGPVAANGDDLRTGLLRFSGVVKDTPSDFARNHDHYLHGTPKR